VTPWLRTLRSAGLLLVVAAGAVHPSYAASYAASHPAPIPAPTADASRAGSSAGEGRRRPGRTESPPGDAHDDSDGTDGTADSGGTDDYGDDTTPTYTDRDPAVPDSPEAIATPEASRGAVVPVQQNVVGPGPAPEPVLQILPLGSGLILIGLGLGLAFLALRVRRR
jgi:hypothetical protein